MENTLGFTKDEVDEVEVPREQLLLNIKYGHTSPRENLLATNVFHLPWT